MTENVAGRFVGGLFLAEAIQFGLHVLQDIDRAKLRTEGAHIAEREDATRRRDQALRRLNAGEFFPAGWVLLEGPDGRPEAQRVEAAVTETDFVLLDAEEEITRIPRSEVTGLRLLDEYGEPVSHPPTELQEMDQPDRLYVVWLDRRAMGGPGGHVFVFHAWSVADEARRDFERNLRGAT
ncbi:MAG: hypothetical protein ACRDFR_03060 [Candidatus Limnocylindria bacterium]